MHEILEAIILGIIQGLTEFLPVSSSGHLELGKYILGDDSLPAESLLMTVVVHFATALSTVVVFRKDITDIVKNAVLEKGKGDYSSFIGYIIISMIPATFVGLFFEKEIESLFSQNIVLVSSMLLVTGFLLLFTYKAGNTTGQINNYRAFVIGLSQAFAILPGVSRSGATISASLYLGVDKQTAARFSFLMVVPLILGKMAKDLLEGNISFHPDQILPLAIAGITAFFTGYLACSWMINIVKRSKLTYFAYYCFIVGIIGLVFSFLNAN
jgi:undecaprenyl-diphosphatase